jgi:hypothetical protein
LNVPSHFPSFAPTTHARQYRRSDGCASQAKCGDRQEVLSKFTHSVLRQISKYLGTFFVYTVELAGATTRAADLGFDEAPM